MNRRRRAEFLRLSVRKNERSATLRSFCVGNWRLVKLHPWFIQPLGVRIAEKPPAGVLHRCPLIEVRRSRAAGAAAQDSRRLE
ncbi:hypothetical protein SUGI_0695430 [Cryptomeria japonica]|nr:hypothetical protein SUGI_0695430 [Cryptomeria japonica]